MELKLTLYAEHRFSHPVLSVLIMDLYSLFMRQEDYRRLSMFIMEDFCASGSLFFVFRTRGSVKVKLERKIISPKQATGRE